MGPSRTVPRARWLAGSLAHPSRASLERGGQPPLSALWLENKTGRARLGLHHKTARFTLSTYLESSLVAV